MIGQEKCLNKEQLFAYANNLLEPGEANDARAHVERCGACLSVVKEFQRLDTVLDEWKSVPPSGSFDARVRTAVASRK